MPFDPYAICPGGRDKKIRFCCPNMLKEIEQVGRLLESGQTGSCLSYIESLEKVHPDCACLITAKLSAYRSENRWQESLSVAEHFHVREPDNPAAAAEYSMALVVTGNPKLAISILVDAFEQTKADTVHSTLLRAALQVGTYFLLNGLAIPAIAIGHVLKEIPATAEQANRFLYSATSDPDVPILLRDWSFDYNCPDNFPGKEAFEEVAVFVRLMRWKQALTQLESLTQYADVWAGIWRNVAAIHFWLMDNDKGCEALKMYASLPNTPLEDAVEAETTRLLFVPDPLGDQTEMLTIDYTITDTEKALEKLLSEPFFYYIDIRKWRTTPPPRGGFVILDRPLPPPETVLTIENVSSRQAIAFLFGKETDQEARLHIDSFPSYRREIVETKIRDALGNLIQIPGKIVKQNHASKTQILLECDFFMPSENPNSQNLFQKLTNDYYQTSFIESWLALPLGLLDGKTPTEAANESKYTIPLLAAIQTIELWTDNINIDKLVANVRVRLRLPTLDTITVTDNFEEDPLTNLDTYPVWRWHRFDVSKLSTDILADGLQIVASMKEFRAVVRFAEELLNRPMDSMEFPVRIMAFESLITASQIHGDIENAWLWIERAKNESVAQKVPDAAWCLHEITLHLMQKNGQAAHDVIQYLITHYRNDAAVMQSLQTLLVELGFFNPDGTPSTALSRAMAETKQPENQKIWTPESEVSASPAAPSKLWVPD